MKRSSPFALLLATLLCGCADHADRGAAAADGTAVGQVQNAEDTAAALWRISAEPRVEIGGPDAGFVLVTAAVRTVTGFVAADAGTGEVRFYDNSGRLVRQAGGKGRGPGEFQHIGWMGLAGDSLRVWDPVLRRVSVFSREGSFTRDYAPAGLKGSFPSVYGAFADGTLLMSTGMESASVPPASGAWRDTMVLLRIGPTGEVADTIGRYPGSARYAATTPDGIPQTHSVPFGPTTSIVVHDDEVYVATGDRYEVVILSAGGQPRKLIRGSAAPVPVTARERRSYAANLLQSGTPTDQQAQQAMIESAPFPRTMAPVVGLRVDDAGNVWVREPQSPDSWDRLSRWSVFDPEGRRAAKVDAPGRFAPFAIGPDWVLGRKIDPDGTEHVHLYGLER